jgi:holo-[acyl-carrier protein] synthase
MSKAKPHVHFAARFAAKEAVFKALRLPTKTPLCWKDIVIERDDDGAPRLVLHGNTLATADTLGVTSLHLSLSHGDNYAVAMVIAERCGY